MAYRNEVLDQAVVFFYRFVCTSLFVYRRGGLVDLRLTSDDFEAHVGLIRTRSRHRLQRIVLHSNVGSLT